jgi:hypothetical protein
MKDWMNKGLTYFLAGLVLLCVLWLILQTPGGRGGSGNSPGTENPFSPAANLTAADQAGELPPASFFLSFFPGSYRPVSRAPGSQQNPVPVQETELQTETSGGRADWISYLGTAAGDDGLMRYSFKNERTNRIHILRPGVPGAGWTLLEIQSSSFILDVEGTQYEVRQ